MCMHVPLSDTFTLRCLLSDCPLESNPGCYGDLSWAILLRVPWATVLRLAPKVTTFRKPPGTAFLFPISPVLPLYHSYFSLANKIVVSLWLFIQICVCVCVWERERERERERDCALFLFPISNCPRLSPFTHSCSSRPLPRESPLCFLLMPMCVHMCILHIKFRWEKACNSWISFFPLSCLIPHPYSLDLYIMAHRPPAPCIAHIHIHTYIHTYIHTNWDSAYERKYDSCLSVSGLIHLTQCSPASEHFLRKTGLMFLVSCFLLLFCLPRKEEEGINAHEELKSGTGQEINICWIPVLCHIFYTHDPALHWVKGMVWATY
jgi:hypothetical protein